MSDIRVPRAPFIPPIPDFTPLLARLDAIGALGLLDLPAQVSTLSGAVAASGAALAGKADKTAVALALADKAALALVPALATAPPPAVVQDGAAGSSGKAAREDHTHKLRYKRAALVTDANGRVAVTWAEAFASVPVMSMPVVMDATAGNYTATCIANTAAGCTFQIKKARPLPAVIALLGTLVNYDTWQPAPAGLTVYVSGAEATQ